MGLFQFVYEKSMTYKWIKRLATSTLRLLDHLHDYAVLIALTKLNVRFATLGMAAWGSIPILVQNVKFETLTVAAAMQYDYNEKGDKDDVHQTDATAMPAFALLRTRAYTG